MARQGVREEKRRVVSKIVPFVHTEGVTGSNPVLPIRFNGFLHKLSTSFSAHRPFHPREKGKNGQVSTSFARIDRGFSVPRGPAEVRGRLVPVWRDQSSQRRHTRQSPPNRQKPALVPAPQEVRYLRRDGAAAVPRLSHQRPQGPRRALEQSSTDQTDQAAHLQGLSPKMKLHAGGKPTGFIRGCDTKSPE